MQKLLLLLLLCSSYQCVLSFTDGLLPNGNFESGPKKSDLKGTVVTSPTAIPEWEISGYIEYIKSGQKQRDMLLVVPEGDFAVRLGNNGAIKQKVTKLVTGNFYAVAFGTPNFDQMKGNRICKQIPWRSDDEELFTAWREARTGYPWIDAIMVQLHKWGWMHHLARHCVACFLTRGDMFVHWEKGRDVFERLLIDSDWPLNNANWLWLSCSSFFYQYNRIYSPISFGKKYDPNGNYIRHFLPVLKDMPKEYIYEPWTAPLSVQTKAKCIIGRDYPKPVVSHDSASKECKKKMAEAYALNQRLNGSVSDEALKNLRRKLEDDQAQDNNDRKQKQKL